MNHDETQTMIGEREVDTEGIRVRSVLVTYTEVERCRIRCCGRDLVDGFRGGVAQAKHATPNRSANIECYRSMGNSRCPEHCKRLSRKIKTVVLQ